LIKILFTTTLDLDHSNLTALVASSFPSSYEVTGCERTWNPFHFLCSVNGVDPRSFGPVVAETRLEHAVAAAARWCRRELSFEVVTAIAIRCATGYREHDDHQAEATDFDCRKDFALDFFRDPGRDAQLESAVAGSANVKVKGMGSGRDVVAGRAVEVVGRQVQTVPCPCEMDGPGL
jgi:hypothetical protein